MLGVLSHDQLRRCYFPLGLSRKAEVRAEAGERGLAVANKPDSHDICFIADGDTAGILERRLGSRPGDIVDVTGVKVGEHAGAHRFTVGQRRGLRLGTPAADGEPRFVLSITPTTNTITVGPRDALAIKIINVIALHLDRPSSGCRVVRSGTDSGPWPADGRHGSCRDRAS